MRAEKTKLDASRHRYGSQAFVSGKRRRIVGQEDSIRADRPVRGVLRRDVLAGPACRRLLFLGPTGSGKMRVVEAPSTVVVREAKAPAALPSAVPPPQASNRRKTDT